MDKAYSLIELMVGMVISLMALSAVLVISRTMVGNHLENRSRYRKLSTLDLGAGELEEFLSGRERPFFEGLVMRPEFIHPFEHMVGDMAFQAQCPGEFLSSCFAFYNLVPTSDMALYKVGSFISQDEISLIPMDPTQPPELDKDVQSMSVLLFSDGSREEPLLVGKVDGNSVQLVPRDQHPWDLGDPVVALETQVVVIGNLEITHVGLKSGPGYKNRLTYRPFSFQNGQWEKLRSFSSYKNFSNFHLSANGHLGPEIHLEVEVKKQDKGELKKYVSIL